INKMSTIINAFNRHSSIFSNEIASKCLYEKLDKNELNDQIFAELYIELDNKIRSGEIDLKLNKSNFNQVNFNAIRQLVSKAIENDNTNLDTENDNANLENDNANLENDNANLENGNDNLEIKKALMKDINRNTYIINGEEIKSKNQNEAMKEFETLIKDISEKNKKAIYYLLNQEGITLIKSYN
ncbi:hypothetical protein NOM91_18345, partial [Proteus mirabilis]|nr:hypothetical protein [Proteus mirabilis]